jgi:hypothetical protein
MSLFDPLLLLTVLTRHRNCTPASPAENSTPPLADFFLIAGVDGSGILDTFLKLGDSALGPAVADMIQEDDEPEDEQALTSESSIRPKWQQKRLLQTGIGIVQRSTDVDTVSGVERHEQQPKQHDDKGGFVTQQGIYAFGGI